MIVASFDLDGTLAEKNFDHALWFGEIPRLYSEKYGVSFSEAVAKLTKDYESVGDKSLSYYEPSHWFRKYGLEASHKTVMKDLSHLIKLFPDTIPALKKLKSKGIPLVVVSNASRDFISLKMQVDGLGSFFEKVYSATSDFGKVDKAFVYRRACADLGIKPSQLFHVGDHYEFDYLQAKAEGANAFYLDRNKTENGKNVVYSLAEFADVILANSSL